MKIGRLAKGSKMKNRRTAAYTRPSSIMPGNKLAP
jgi:hypothetical protein